MSPNEDVRNMAFEDDKKGVDGSDVLKLTVIIPNLKREGDAAFAAGDHATAERKYTEALDTTFGARVAARNRLRDKRSPT